MKKRYMAGLALTWMFCIAGMAQATTIDDSVTGASTYWGANSASEASTQDVYAPASQSQAMYDLTKMDVVFNHSTLTVTIHSPLYFQAWLSGGTDGTNFAPGDLFLSTNDGWGADSSGNNYKNDHAGSTAVNNSWEAVIKLNGLVTTDVRQAAGTASVYNTNTTDGSIVNGAIRTGQEWNFQPFETSPLTTAASWKLLGVPGTYTAMEITMTLSNYFINVTELGLHYTMQCGNDVIEGKAAPVPEPTTMLLFGTGLAGLAGLARRRVRQ